MMIKTNYDVFFSDNHDDDNDNINTVIIKLFKMADKISWDIVPFEEK